MSAQLYKTRSGRLFHAGAIAIVTVGLPARGKTHICRSLRRYLNWVGVKTEVFHVGDYRRKLIGLEPNDFFDPANEATASIRENIVQAAVRDMIAWFFKGGQVGILDATNTLRSKREKLYHSLHSQGIEVIFVESVCEIPEIIESNIMSVKISSPDYVDWDPEEAKVDFQRRIDNHKAYYETLDEKDIEMSYIKIINLEQVIINQVKGYLQTKIVYYLMNLHITHRAVYFVKTAACHQKDSLVSDPKLSEEGLRYARALKEIILSRHHANVQEGQRNRDLKIWTSTGTSSIQTGKEFLKSFDKPNSPTTELLNKANKPESVLLQPRKALVQMDTGVCRGLSDEDIKAKYPFEHEERKTNMYRHRFPRAESYLDLAVRLESVIMELEREKDDVVIIAHESVLQCLYGYFFDRTENEIPYLRFGYDHIVEVIPSAYGSKQTLLPSGVEPTLSPASSVSSLSPIPSNLR